MIVSVLLQTNRFMTGPEGQYLTTMDLKHVILLLATLSAAGVQTLEVTAEVGGTVILPVKVDLAEDSELLYPTIIWWTENEEGVVHQYRTGTDYNEHQVERFMGRTSLFNEEIKKGNISLRIINVTINDNGVYTCEVLHGDPDIDKTYKVSLWVKEKGGGSMESPKQKKPDQTKGCSVSAKVGETVILPVKVDLTEDSELLYPIISWEHESAGIVHDYWANKDYNEHQVERFMGRTSLFNEEIKKGNISLKIINVTKSDAGNYICEVFYKGPKIYRVSLCVTEKSGNIDPTQSPGLTMGELVGIILGVVIGLTVLIAAAFIVGGVFLRKKRKATKRKHDAEADNQAMETLKGG